ncbi:hypothetical protein PsYK624_066950 [Phanerochaete sordida]|uniref:Uncharacterized protein n=1 Tax=Phanerochaete sordida TaxID=48140 RepID=A0A9P3LDN5_9APHY|nr:hypothetical protein PsYK624_066950 [Phanerochaete sordida]
MTNNNAQKGSKVPRVSEEEEVPFCPVRTCKYSRENGGGLETYEDLLKHYEKAHANDRDGEGRNPCPYVPKYAPTNPRCKAFDSARKLVDHLAYHYDVRRYRCDFKRGSCERYGQKDPAAVRCNHRAFDRSALLKHYKSEHSAATGRQAAQRGNAHATTSSGANTEGAAMASMAVYDAPTPGLTDAASPVPSPLPATPRELDDTGDGLVARQVTGPGAQASTSTALAHAPGQAYLHAAPPPPNAYVPAGNPSFTHVPAQAQINVPVSAREHFSGSEGMWAMPVTSAEIQAILASRAHNASLSAHAHTVLYAAAVGAHASASAHSSPRPAALRTARPSRYAPYASPRLRPSSAAIAMPLAPPFDPAPRSYSAPVHDVVPGGLFALDGAAQQPALYNGVQHAPAQYAPAQPAPAHLAPVYAAPAVAAVAQELDAGYPNAWNIAAGAGYEPAVAAYAAPAATANFAPDTYPTIAITRATPLQPSIYHASAYDQLAPASDQELDAEPWHQFPLSNAPALSEEDVAKRLAEREALMQQMAAYRPLPDVEPAPVPPPPMLPTPQAAGYEYASGDAPLGLDAVLRHLVAEYRSGDVGQALYQQAQGPDAFGCAVHPYDEYGPC